MAYRRTERVEAWLADNQSANPPCRPPAGGRAGFEGPGSPSIAASAGVAVGTVYRYFSRPKPTSLPRSLRSVSQREVDVLREIADSGGPASERLTAAVHALPVAPSAGAAWRARSSRSPSIPRWTTFDWSTADSLRDVRADHPRGIQAEEFPPQDVASSAACLVGAFMEGLVSPLAMESASDDVTNARLIDAIVRFALRAVSGRQPGPADDPTS